MTGTIDINASVRPLFVSFLIVAGSNRLHSGCHAKDNAHVPSGALERMEGDPSIHVSHNLIRTCTITHSFNNGIPSMLVVNTTELPPSRALQYIRAIMDALTLGRVDA